MRRTLCLLFLRPTTRSWRRQVAIFQIVLLLKIHIAVTRELRTQNIVMRQLNNAGGELVGKHRSQPCLEDLRNFVAISFC